MLFVTWEREITAISIGECKIRSVCNLARSWSWLTFSPISGQLLNDHGRHGEAAKYYRQAYDLKPEDFEIAFNLANALRQDGDSESAEEFYWIASELKPDVCII